VVTKIFYFVKKDEFIIAAFQREDICLKMGFGILLLMEVELGFVLIGKRSRRDWAKPIDSNKFVGTGLALVASP
jgi:hypothetical protein